MIETIKVLLPVIVPVAIYFGGFLLWFVGFIVFTQNEHEWSRRYWEHSGISTAAIVSGALWPISLPCLLVALVLMGVILILKWPVDLIEKAFFGE